MDKIQELRANLAYSGDPAKGDCRTCRDALRVVDELTEKNTELRKGQVKYMTEQGAFLLSANEKNVDLATRNLELKEERDGLRAKLAEAARIHVESEVTHAYRVKELEAKLAEAEKRAWEAERDDAEWRRVWTLRAEAAEARVRELEAAGFR